MKSRYAVLFTLSLICVSCSNREPVKIGFSGGLTGRVADLGIHGRDGALLAVEEVNAHGGINGHPLELIIEDDQQNPQTAITADSCLIAAGVVAIVGHMTSSTVTAALPLVNKTKMLMVSPTASSNDFTGIDDMLLRVYPASANATPLMADHARNSGCSRAAVLYDIGNRSYTESMAHSFYKAFSDRGGIIVDSITYKGGPNTDFSQLTALLLAHSPDQLVLIVNSMDAAMICQQLAKAGKKIQVMVGEWGANEDVIKFGGASVEGLEVYHTFNRNSPVPAFRSFVERFTKRYSYEPGFGAVHAYDAVMILTHELKKNPRQTDLKAAILATKSYDGLMGKISFDRFGDVDGGYQLMTIRNGRFVPGD